MKKLFFTLVILFSLSAIPALAAPGDPGSGPESGDPPVGADAPIDGGAVALLIAGAAYGAKKIRKKKE